jgi:pyruvate,water dikinase
VESVSSGQLLRGFPSKTFEAQVALEEVARQISDHAELRERVLASPAGDVPRILGQDPVGGAALEALDEYLTDYGHQIYTLDFSEPTQAEDPLPVFVGLQALVEDQERDARAMQAAFAEERDKLAETAAQRFGPIRRPIFRKVLAWAQRFTPHREDAIYYVGAGWPALRRLALELGRRLAEAGCLESSDDVFYLRSDELREAIVSRVAGETRDDLKQLARERRSLRTARMSLQPPATVPIDFRYKIGPISMAAFEPKKNIALGNTLEGFAVSPGRVTAPASVILSPADFEHMRPHTILVCPTTTPAWTPLFAQARGLVTDIGGVLAHGSIVAREYGIPAVMGTTVATERIRSGQSLTVDGSAGTVEIHEC